MRIRRPGRPGGDGSFRPPDRGGRGGPSTRRERRPERPDRAVLTLPAGREALYGRNAVFEALAGRRALHRLLVAEGVREDDRLRQIVQRAQDRSLTIDHVPRVQLDDLTRGANHQGIVLEAGTYAYVDLEDLAVRPATVLVLDHVQDPQNLGTLLRAAEVAGAAGVVIARDRAAEVTPAVVNASAGAVEHLAVAQETNIGRALDRLSDRGWWPVGLDTGPDAVDLFTATLPTPVALVVGSEGSGLSPVVRKRCDPIVSLPVRGAVASLNAATAGAITLFELIRRETVQ